MTVIKIPSAKTLARYGLSIEEWAALTSTDACEICCKLPKTGRLVIDHEHVKGWKKMPPEQRRTYVRGSLCWYCNAKFLSRGMTLDKARNLVAYLERYEKRKG